jgi:hypothetical protein
MRSLAFWTAAEPIVRGHGIPWPWPGPVPPCNQLPPSRQHGSSRPAGTHATCLFLTPAGRQRADRAAAQAGFGCFEPPA